MKGYLLMTSRRATTATALVMLGSLALAACGSDSSTSSGSDETSAEGAASASATTTGAAATAGSSTTAICDIDTITDLLPAGVTNITNLTCVEDYAGFTYGTSANSEGSALFKWNGSEWVPATEACRDVSALPETVQRFCPS